MQVFDILRESIAIKDNFTSDEWSKIIQNVANNYYKARGVVDLSQAEYQGLINRLKREIGPDGTVPNPATYVSTLRRYKDTINYQTTDWDQIVTHLRSVVLPGTNPTPKFTTQAQTFKNVTTPESFQTMASWFPQPTTLANLDEVISYITNVMNKFGENKYRQNIPKPSTNGSIVGTWATFGEFINDPSVGSAKNNLTVFQNWIKEQKYPLAKEQINYRLYALIENLDIVINDHLVFAAEQDPDGKLNPFGNRWNPFFK